MPTHSIQLVHTVENVTDIEVYVDPVHKTIHLLDKDTGGMTLTNAISHEWQEYISNKLLGGDRAGWTWLLYGTDGIACSYSKGQFAPVSDAILYPSFTEEMRKRQM